MPSQCRQRINQRIESKKRRCVESIQDRTSRRSYYRVARFVTPAEVSSLSCRIDRRVSLRGWRWSVKNVFETRLFSFAGLAGELPDRRFATANVWKKLSDTFLPLTCPCMLPDSGFVSETSTNTAGRRQIVYPQVRHCRDRGRPGSSSVI